MSRLEVRKIDTNYTLLMVLVKEGVGCLMSSSFVSFDDGRHEKIKISFRQSVSPSSAPSLGRPFSLVSRSNDGLRLDA